MNTAKDYTTSIVVDQSPEEVFNAITNVRGWWSQEVEGGTSQLNDVFNYHYKEVHICRMRLVEVVPNQKVVWLVEENYFNFIQDQREWKGTKVIFEIFKKGNQTEMKFTHEGLVPENECYAICNEAWTSYINGSLKNLITTGVGAPNPKEGGFNEELARKWQLTER